MRKMGALITLDEALHLSFSEVAENHKLYGNSRLTYLLSTLGMDRKFVKAEGNYIWDEAGNRYIDFLAGYGSVSLGHNHPRVIDALRKVENLPNFLQLSPGTMSAALARNIAMIAPGDLRRTIFSSSGTEAVEGALNLARAATGKTGFVYAEGSFHGKTFASSLSPKRTRHQGQQVAPLSLTDKSVPFGDASALEKALQTGDAAAFIVEPIQGEGGVNVPPDGYLAEVKRLCSEYGALLIADEIQTGLGRTGKMFACELDSTVPDIMCLAKSLGGGVMPLGAFVTTDDIWQKAYGESANRTLYPSTFGGNTRACAAGIAALQVIVEEGLVEAALEKGLYLKNELSELKARHNVIKDIRGRGLLVGVELSGPAQQTLKPVSRCPANTLSEEDLGAMVVKQLVARHHVISAYSLSNSRVVRLEPPLTIQNDDIDYVVAALDKVCGNLPSA